MRTATIIAPLLLASIFGVLVFGGLPNVPTQVPIAPYPSMEEVMGHARPTWGAAFIADELLYIQLGHDWIFIVAPGEADSGLYIGYVTPQYEPTTGEFIVTVEDNAAIDVGTGTVGQAGAVTFERRFTLGFLDATVPLPRMNCACSAQGSTASAECASGFTPVCICLKWGSTGTCVRVVAKPLTD